MMRVRVALSGGSGGPGLMTFYWIGTVEGPATAQEAVDHVRDFLLAGASAIFNGLSWATQADVATINPATGVLTGVIGTTSRSGAGTSTADPLPGHVQGLMSIVSQTIVNGRRLRGHVNLPMPTELFNTNQVPTATYQTTWASATTNLITDVDPAYVVWGSQSHATGTVIATTIQPKWAALRSRRD